VAPVARSAGRAARDAAGRVGQLQGDQRAGAGVEVDVGEAHVGVGQVEAAGVAGVAQAQVRRVLAEHVDDPHDDAQPVRRREVQVGQVEQAPRGEELGEERLLVGDLGAAVLLGEATGLGGRGHVRPTWSGQRNSVAVSSSWT
jgi:hypothetical protein